MPVKPAIRKRLEAQGFCGLDDTTLEQLAPWMRWTYTIGTVVTVIGVALMSPAVLWTLAAITAVGIVLPFNPFDLLYNYGMRHITHTRPFPHSGRQRHFVFIVATVWLIARWVNARGQTGPAGAPKNLTIQGGPTVQRVA